jgi:hypothetical protein
LDVVVVVPGPVLPVEPAAPELPEFPLGDFPPPAVLLVPSQTALGPPEVPDVPDVLGGVFVHVPDGGAEGRGTPELDPA